VFYRKEEVQICNISFEVLIIVKVSSANNSIKYSNDSPTGELELKNVEKNASTPLSSCPLGARPINSWLNRQTNDCLKNCIMTTNESVTKGVGVFFSLRHL
jgi:hypothetical protein